VQPTADPVLDEPDSTAAVTPDGAAPDSRADEEAIVEPVRATASVEPVERPEFLPGIAVPLPDEAAILAAWERLSAIDIGVNAPTVAGLGTIAESVAFIAGVQAHPYPRPILSARVVLITGTHDGGVAVGPNHDPRESVPLQQLASAAGAGTVTLQWDPAAEAIEVDDAISSKQLDAAMRAGWAEAERAADEGIELLVLAAGGPGASAAAVAVISAISGYETSALLGRVVTPGGVYDDNAWMARAVALRDAMHRVRHRDGDPRTVLAALGGSDIAAATGLILGAASRRLPMMIDGPVGAAASMVANDFAPYIRRWIMLPDSGRNVAVIVAAEALELRPWLDLCLDLGEGATSLSALPLLQMALTLAGAGTPVEPGPLARLDSQPEVFVGVARPVEVADATDDVEEKAQPQPVPSAALTAPTTSIGEKAKATARPAPKPVPAKAAPAKAAKAAAAKAKGSGGRTSTAKATGTKPTAAKATTPKAGATSPATTGPAGAQSADKGPADTQPGRDEPETTRLAADAGQAEPAKAAPADAGPAKAGPAKAPMPEAGPTEAGPAAPGRAERAEPEPVEPKSAEPESAEPESAVPDSAAQTSKAATEGDAAEPAEGGTGVTAPRPRKRP
jgi:hypothetical protein